VTAGINPVLENAPRGYCFIWNCGVCVVMPEKLRRRVERPNRTAG